MNRDLEDLTFHEPTEFERRLIDAARAERPSAELSARMAQGLGLPGASASALGAAKSGLSLWMGFGALAALTGAFLAWALWVRDSAPAVALPPPAAPVAQVAPPSVTKAPEAETAPVLPPPVAELAPKAQPTQPTASAKATGERGDLREEIRLIDAARSAVAARSYSDALGLLRRYTSAYPNGMFGQEASVLRLEALDRSGQHDRAQALARDFVARHPNSPLAERAERVAK